MKLKTSFFVFAILSLSLAGCVNKAPHTTFKCGRLLSEKELVRLNKTSYKDYKTEDLELLAALTTLVNETSGDSLEHEVFFREKTASSLTMEVFGVEAPLTIEKVACSIFGRTDLKLPAEQKILFHKYLNGGTGSEFLIGLANK